MNTTQTKADTIFKNLFKAIKAERAKWLQEFIAGVNEETSIEKLTAPYSSYSELIPASRKGYKWELEELREYLIARKIKTNDKEIEKKLAHLQTVENAGDLVSIVVSIEWKKSRMWGSNPTAEARVNDTKDYHNYNSGSIGGCGYDKQSTAVADVVNQSNAFLKAMYLMKEKHPKTDNRTLFGYGSGYGILPRLEGGVGVSCYPKIFETIGYNFETTAWGKTFDVYTITKK